MAKKSEKIKEIVESKSSFLCDVLGGGHRETTKFKIPTYQRVYSWKGQHVKRLFETIGWGFVKIDPDDKSYLSPVFLGTLIFAEENSNKNSLLVIDGQQRMITIMLLIGAIRQKLSRWSKKSDKLKDKEILKWLQESVIKPLAKSLTMCNCICTEEVGSKPRHYPKIVRQHDDPNENEDSGYASDIGAYLHELCKGNNDTRGNFNREVIGTIDRYLNKIIEGKFPDMESDTDIDPTDIDLTDKLKSEEYQRLICGRDDTSPTFEKTKQMLEEIYKIQVYQDNIYLKICTLASFANYLLYRVVLNTVEVKNKYEDEAFDIFESLNTTGEPLTAIQTLKPSVYDQLKQENTEYQNSKEKNYFSYIDDTYLTKMEDQQKESTQLVDLFFYYSIGEKTYNSLNAQRKKLRKEYAHIRESDNKRLYVKSLSKIAEYKDNFWWKQRRDFTTDNDFLICLRLLKDTGLKLTIPILARYWQESDNDNKLYIDAVKSVTAFVVLRRAATEGTANIDNDFRKILKENALFDACGKIREEILDIDALKKNLRSYLREEQRKKAPITKKDDWVKHVSEHKIYGSSPQSICKFILLCSASYTKVAEGKTFLEKVYRRVDNKLLTMDHWEHPFYKTVEHIAPQSNSERKWSNDIYQNNRYDCIGNLTLLPSKDNSIVGNADFKTKKIMYQMFIEEKEKQRSDLIQKLRQMNKNLKNSQFAIDKGSSHPNLFQAIINEEGEWNLEKINNRSKNLLELTWDMIAPWLDFDN